MNLTLFENPFFNELDTFVDAFTNGVKPYWRGISNIPEDLLDYEDRYEISIELPGVMKEDIDVSIDRRIPSDKIPKNLLDGSVKVLDGTLKAMDLVYDVVEKVKQVVFYSCIATIAFDFVCLQTVQANSRFSRSSSSKPFFVTVL